jgi:hypothetical protein
MLILLLCAAMVVAWRWPQAPVGRALHQLLVDGPALQLAELDLGRVLPKRVAGRVALALLVLLAIGLIAVAIARSDVFFFLAQGMPEGIAWFATFDIATYLDVIAVGLVLGATMRLRALYGAFKAWAARSVAGRAVRRAGSARARARAPRPERKTPPSNDDEPAWAGFGLAVG